MSFSCFRVQGFGGQEGPGTGCWGGLVFLLVLFGIGGGGGGISKFYVCPLISQN